jgi:phage shock protein B
MEWIVIPILLIVFGVPCLFAWLIIRMLVQRRDGARLSRTEQEGFQQMWAMMQKMEERIANLEAILEPRDRKLNR